MEQYSHAAIKDAVAVQSEAEHLAGLSDLAPSSKQRVPAQWMAWLLMEKAGMPHDLIAFVSHVDERDIRRGLLVVKLRMVWPPFAARIEWLMRQMPRYRAAHALAKEGKCAALVG